MGRSPDGDTYFAPARRVSSRCVAEERLALESSPLTAALLDSMHEPALVLDQTRQVVAANGPARAFLEIDSDESILGRRPGEIMGCVHAEGAPGGCGTNAACAHCGAVLAVIESLSSCRQQHRECRIRIKSDRDGGALDLSVRTTPMAVDGEDFVIAALRDISDDKRRRVLERVFFHDVMNTAGGLQGLADLLADEDDPALIEGYIEDVQRLAGQVVDEIRAQRLLMAAEEGELIADVAAVSLRPLLEEVAAVYRHHPVSRGQIIDVRAPEGVLLSDGTVLRRVLGNLVKNAIEATAGHHHIGLSASWGEGGSVVFEVHNPTVIPEEVQLQIFQRSFSTKGGHGRGIGTYSIKLFAERVLGGEVSFTSVDGRGTTFRVELPATPPG